MVFIQQNHSSSKRGSESPEKIHAVARESCISAIGDEQLFLARLERVRLQGSSWSDLKVLVKHITDHKLFFGQIKGWFLVRSTQNIDMFSATLYLACTCTCTLYLACIATTLLSEGFDFLRFSWAARSSSVSSGWQ